MKYAMTLITAVAALCGADAAVPFSWTASAALPQKWDVELTAQPPQVFTLQRPRGETYELEAVLKHHGKPFAPAITNACIYWQTNGMENLYWSAPASVSNNCLRASWIPSMDPGATSVRGYIGDPGRIYAAAFQFRFIASPGPTPNVLPLPTPVIDFAQVRVLNPPWPTSAGTDTNAVRDIIHATVDGAARPLPRYLHIYNADDSYPDEAAEYYRSRGDGKVDGGCSAVRSGGYLSRNFDFPFDDRSEFVVKMSAGKDRFASVGIAQVGTNLTEAIVTSGKPEFSARYKWLPGATVDGINEHGVVAEINVVDGAPPRRLGGDIHPLAAVRWALDNGTSAEMVATNLASRIKWPVGWSQNFHWMIADQAETWIVENGTASNVTAVAAKRVMTNFAILPDTYTGMGKERYQILRGGANITNAWYTRAYSPTANWASEFRSVAEQNAATNGWARLGTMEARRATGLFWQSVHTSIYDLTNRTLRIAVQEQDDWYTFALAKDGTDEAKVREIASEVVAPVASNVADLASQIEEAKLELREDIYRETAAVAQDASEWDDEIYQDLSEDIGTVRDEVDAVSGIARDAADDAADAVRDAFNANSRANEAYLKATRAREHSEAVSNRLEQAELTIGETSAVASAADAKADEALVAANDANVWSGAIYNFMTGGRTNCWFAGTNYVFGSDAATRQKFAWEDGMDAATVPCSMALWEIRDGERQLVWDQRDWTAWYWSFKAHQMQTNMTAQIDALGNAVTNDANYAWAKRYASDGTPNPDATTTFIDTPSVTLSPGMKWETVATVSGAAYWTIVGNGAVIGGSGTNAVLSIRDFEGNEIMTVTKGEHRLAWLERGDITGQMYDADGWVCFDMLADVEPVGYFSTTLESSDFTPQTDPNCPAQYLWENIGGGKYRVHFLLKPGISAKACFAKFQVEVEGQTIIRYNAGQEISGGLIYNGVKIAPDISGSPAVGTVIQWKVVR